jgi:ankyrin repeat protein
MAGVLLRKTVERGDFLRVKFLVKNGDAANNSESDHEGYTALLTAAFYGHSEIVRWLLTKEGGASITEASKMGYTALLLSASFHGGLPLVQWLLTKKDGARITEKDNSGNTALLLSSLHGHWMTAKWLIEQGGADVEETNNSGKTIWHRLEKHLVQRTPQLVAVKALLQVTIYF